MTEVILIIVCILYTGSIYNLTQRIKVLEDKNDNNKSNKNTNT